MISKWIEPRILEREYSNEILSFRPVAFRTHHAVKNEEKKWDGERFRIFDRAKEESSIRRAIDICICESYESYFERKRERRFPSDIFDYSSSRFAPSFLDTHNHNFPISSRKICNTPGRYLPVYHRVSHRKIIDRNWRRTVYKIIQFDCIHVSYTYALIPLNVYQTMPPSRSRSY